MQNNKILNRSMSYFPLANITPNDNECIKTSLAHKIADCKSKLMSFW